MVYPLEDYGKIKSDQSINYLELLAIFLGLQCFVKHTRKTHIRILSDNTTAVNALNNMGTIHSE